MTWNIRTWYLSNTLGRRCHFLWRDLSKHQIQNQFLYMFLTFSSSWQGRIFYIYIIFLHIRGMDGIMNFSLGLVVKKKGKKYEFSIHSLVLPPPIYYVECYVKIIPCWVNKSWPVWKILYFFFVWNPALPEIRENVITLIFLFWEIL